MSHLEVLALHFARSFADASVTVIGGLDGRTEPADSISAIAAQQSADSLYSVVPNELSIEVTFYPQKAFPALFRWATFRF
jgi:hypothetical protein